MISPVNGWRLLASSQQRSNKLKKKSEHFTAHICSTKRKEPFKQLVAEKVAKHAPVQLIGIAADWKFMS
jgi:hypothetical protein